MSNKKEIELLNEEEFELTDKNVAYEYFKNYYQEIKDDIPTKNVTYLLNNYADSYNSLSELNKHIVDNAIRNLLPEEKLLQYFGYFFQKVLDDSGMKAYELATIVCGNYCEKENTYQEMTIDNINGNIKSFLKNKKFQEKNRQMVEDICKVLSIDMDVLRYGIGTRFYIDSDEVDRIIKQENIDSENFWNDFIKEAIPCNNCKICNSKKYQTGKANFCKHDIKNNAEIIAKLLNVDISRILIKEDYQIPLESNPIEEYFKKLSVKEQKMIVRLIVDLHFKETRNMFKTY